MHASARVYQYCASLRAGAIAALVCIAAAGAEGAAAPPVESTEQLVPLPAEQPRFLPDLETIAEADERPVFEAVVLKIASDGLADPDSTLAALDKALQQLQRPTKLRGYIQYSRASMLMALNRNAEAIDAIEESIRLLDGYSAPLIVAAGIYGYNNQADIGTDYLLRASRLDPVSVRALDDYEIANLTRRLHSIHDTRRVSALSERLLEINWTGRRLSSRSALALEAIKLRMREGDLEGARGLLSKLLVPTHSRQLMINRAYSPIWGDIEAWTGPRFEVQWRTYLREARDRWTASKDTEALGDYARALEAAGHDQTIIREIVPVFWRSLDLREDQNLLFVVTPVAGALAREGRWADVDRLFQRVLEIWPLGSQPNALNAAGNRARFLLFADRPKEALTQIDAAIADARNWGAGINLDAMAAMHFARACILHELGRDTDAATSVAYVASTGQAPNSAALQLCMGNPSAAKNALIQALEFEPQRDEVLAFMQPDSLRAFPSNYGRRASKAAAQLRTDPELIAAVEKYGRILPFALNAAAPPEQP